VTHNAERQQLSTDTIIEILIVEHDGVRIYVTHERNSRDPRLKWAGIELALCDFKSEGFEARGDDESPSPSISMSMIDPTIRAYLAAHDQGRGATLTRQKIFLKNLDGESEADPTQVFAREIYRVSKATREFPEIRWQLISSLEMAAPEFPHVTLTKSYCDFIYRRWNGTLFTPGTCPYAAAPMFALDNVSTTVSSEDKCSKTITGCRKRYGNNPVPFRGTLGVRR
jgi:lambda family phage minor tail protein L